MDEKEKEWYSNKELFEQIQGLRVDLTETQQAVKKYNNLHAAVCDHEERLNAIDNRGEGKQSVEAAILRWLPAIIAFIALIVSIFIK